MLVIRQPQIDAMLARQKNEAANILAQSLREHSPFFQYYTDKQLQQWVIKQIDYLANLGISDKGNVVSIIEIIALYGDKFERCADPTWALEIIEDTERNEGFRATSLQYAHKKQRVEQQQSVEHPKV